MKRLLPILLLSLFTSTLSSQVVVHGRVLDATNHEAIDMATIQMFIFKSTDSLFIQGAQTDTEGGYYLQKVRPGNYKLYISHLGYSTICHIIHVQDENLTVSDILMKETVQELSQVEVKGHAAEMTVKGDTIEYNTAAYKVGENDMVEDLLKKMQGMQVDKDGNVTVNGEDIKAVRIDGKKFFGDDVQTATKNIPADMVEKIQIVDEKSDAAKMSGFDDDETERIINLQIKKNRKKGSFGNYSGSIGADAVADNGRYFDYDKQFFGNDFRYSASLFTNILSDIGQTTILGGANNTNEIRMGRSFSGMGQNNNGITWSENIGVNTNIDLDKQIRHKDNKTSMVFGGDVSFNHSHNDTKTESTRESYSRDALYTDANTTASLSNGWGVTARLELDYQIDTLNHLLVQPRISYTDRNNTSHDDYDYERNDTLINSGYQDRAFDSHNISAGIKLVYNHRFLHPGRSLTLTGDVNIINNTGYSQTYSYDQLLNQTKVNQHTPSTSNNLSYSFRTSYVEPIYKNQHLLEFALSYSGSTRKSDKNQQSYDTIANAYVYDSLYSNALTNIFHSEAAEINYKWKDDHFDLTLGLKLNPSQTHSVSYYGHQLYRDTLLNIVNWSPNASFRYKFDKKQFLRFTYRGTSSQPTITQMEPVRNNSNAMQESLGNLGLQPSFRHSFRLLFSRFNQQTFSSMMAGLRGNITKDALVNNTIYDETGKVYHQTVNAREIPFDIGGDFMYNTPFCRHLMQFHTRTAVSYNRRVAYSSPSLTAEQIAVFIAEDRVQRGNLNQTNNVSVQEELGLRFTHAIVDVGLDGRFAYTHTANSIRASNQTNVFDWTISCDLTLHLPKSWNIATDCGYTARYGYRLNDVNEIKLNAKIDKTWGNATLTLQMYDLLNSKKNIVQIISDNAVTYSKYNSLPTYFLLTFTYKFNKMGDLKAKGMVGHIQSMMESGNDAIRQLPSPPHSSQSKPQ